MQSCILPHGVNTKTVLITKNTAKTRHAGINAANDLATVGGTPFGIFIVQFLLTIYTYNLVAKNAARIPTNIPFAPNLAIGITSLITVPLSAVTVSGVNTKNAATATPAANIASTLFVVIISYTYYHKQCSYTHSSRR